MRTLLITIAIAAFGTQSPAANAGENENVGWHGSGELGLAIAKGNTDNETLVGKLGAGRETDRWKHAFGASFLHGKSDQVESARRYEIHGTSGYRLNDRSYVFGSLRNERDHFAPNEYQWTAAVGYGHEAIKNATTHLTFEIGPGYRWAKLQGVRIHRNEAILRGYMDAAHALNDSTSLYDTLLIEAGSSNTFVRNDLGVQVKMTDALALKAGYEIRHNTEVAAGRRSTDRLTTVNVVYGF